jgi:hypothetical protein
MTYDPLTGANWDRLAAVEAWSESMGRVLREQRSPHRWNLRGMPGSWRWTFFNFGPWTGAVAIELDGFHWATTSYDTDIEEHQGKTTSLFEAFQSVEQNKEVKLATAHGQALRWKSGRVITEDELDECAAEAALRRLSQGGPWQAGERERLHKVIGDWVTSDPE